MKKIIYLSLFFVVASAVECMSQSKLAEEELTKNFASQLLPVSPSTISSNYFNFYHHNISLLGTNFSGDFQIYTITKNLFLNYKSKSLDYDFDQINFDTSKISTSFHYYRGNKKEQLFIASHLQKLSNNFRFGIRYRSIVVPGYFRRQFFDKKSFAPKLTFESKRRDVSASVEYLSNVTKQQQNGGILNDSSILNTNGVDLRTLGVKLDNAENKTNRNGIGLGSNIILSVLSDTQRVKTYYLDFAAKYTKVKENFVCSTPKEISDFYLDSLITNDTAFCKLLNINLGIGFINDKRKVQSLLISSYLTLEQQHLELKNQMLRRQIISSCLHASFMKDTSFIFDIDVRVALQKKLFFAKYKVVKMISEKPSIEIVLSGVNATMPAKFEYTHVRSNNFVWNLEPTPFFRNEFNVFFNVLNWKVGYSIFSMRNFYYLNSDLFPELYSFSVSKVYVSYIRKAKGWEASCNLQYNIVKGENVLGVTGYSIIGGIGRRLTFFKNKLQLQTGMNVFYSPFAYYNGFAPGINMYYYQSEIRTGGFPRLNFVLEASVKEFTFIARLDNIMTGLLDAPMFDIPHYPTERRMLRIGFNWNFDK